MSEWISVEERLPPKSSGEVIWYHPALKDSRGGHSHSEYIRVGSYDLKNRPASHWMPLPKPPKQ